MKIEREGEHGAALVVAHTVGGRSGVRAVVLDPGVKA